ncbi:MAG: hypothetical protein ACD_41C00287G0005 [uncultured bacterium]|nr:MAG: hypothetical protein ACD_41C00287G0005 [uncultured bacterium]HBY73934.1 hypothetical protein [Candidatus Kerfeldbacteria bacterium]
MFNNPLFYLALFAATSGMSLPQTLAEEWYFVPTHHIAEPVNVGLLPRPVFRTVPAKVDQDTGPVVQAKSAMVLDQTSGAVLWQKEPDMVLPIASISKLMTAVVAQDFIDNWEETYTLQWSEVALGGSTFSAGVGDTFTKHDLLKSALVGSVNSAAAAVAHSTGLAEADFVAEMNSMADRLGMLQTNYVEPTGLSANNTSTAQDIALLFRTVTADPLLMEPLGQAEHRLVNGDQEMIVKTTNRLVKNGDPYVFAGKTGFTYEAGNCLAAVARDAAGHQIIVVVLGAPDEDSRFAETAELAKWTFDHYRW